MNAHPIHFVSWRVPIFSKRSASGTNNNMKKEKGREKKMMVTIPFRISQLRLVVGKKQGSWTVTVVRKRSALPRVVDAIRFGALASSS
jgi:hypothetical protein